MEWIISILQTTPEHLQAGALTIAALVASLVGGAGSMIGSAKANKNRQKNLENEKAESKGFFDKEYYTSELDRTENQSMLRTLTERMKENNQRNLASNAITGATPEVALAQQNNANKAYGDTVNRLAGMASQRKSILAYQRNADRRNLYGMQDGIDQSRAQSWSNLGSNAANLGAAGLMAGAYGNGLPGVGTQTGMPTGDIIPNNYDNLT